MLLVPPSVSFVYYTSISFFLQRGLFLILKIFVASHFFKDVFIYFNVIVAHISLNESLGV